MTNATLSTAGFNVRKGLNESGASVASSDFFPAGYYEPAVMPMTLIRPCTNATAAGFYSVDHCGYVGRQSQVRITVQGGAFPYVVVPESLPSGATVGKTVFDADYMIIKFTPSANGTYNFRLKIYDQNGDYVPVDFYQTVDATWCTFISPTGNDTTGTGTFAAPWLTVNKALTTTTGGKCLILMDGLYPVSTVGNHIQQANANSMIAWNQLGAEIDMQYITGDSLTVFFLENSHQLVQGIIFTNPPTSFNSPRIFSTDKNGWYVFQDNCRFNINGRLGVLNNDNISCFFLGGTGASVDRRYLAQTRNTFDGFTSTANHLANGWSAFDMYRTKFFVCEGNIFQNQLGYTLAGAVIWVKGENCSYIDIRLNRFENGWQGYSIDIYLAAANDNAAGNIDVSYNYLGGSDITLTRSAYNFTRLPIWLRRNTLKNGVIYSHSFGGNSTVYSNGDVLQSATTLSNAGAYTYKVFWNDTSSGLPIKDIALTPRLTYSITNYECHQNSGVTDANGLLTGTYRTNHLGKRGCEIYKP